MEPLTEEELARIEAEHVDNGHGFCLVEMSYHAVVCFPCDAARLYDLVERQSVLLVEWGLPCSCDPDFDLPEDPRD